MKRLASEGSTHAPVDRSRSTRRAILVSASADESIDAFFAIAVRLCSILTDRIFAPLSVRLRRPSPPDAGPFARCFLAPVTFDAVADVMTFDKYACDKPLAGANPAMARVSDHVVDETLARMPGARWTDRVRALLVERLPSGEPSQADFTRAFRRWTGRSPSECRREGSIFA